MKRKQTILRSAAIGLLTIGMITSLVKCEETDISPQDPLPSPSSSVSVSAPDDDDTTDTPTEETPATVEITVNGTIANWGDGGNISGQLEFTEDSIEGSTEGESLVALFDALQSKSAKADKTGWETGDQIVISDGGYTSVPYKWNGTSFEPATGVDPISVAPGTRLTASYFNSGGSDNLWARADVQTDGTVTFNFRHVMSKVDVIFPVDSGSIRLENLYLNGKLNHTTGEVTPILNIFQDSEDVPLPQGSNTVTFYLPPQTLTSEFTVVGSAPGLTATWTLKENFKIEAGKSYSITLELYEIS